MTGKAGGKKIEAKGGLVQFRTDDRLLAGLTEVAARLSIPVGVLARLWVSERLNQEMSFDISTIEAWRENRYRVIGQTIEKDFAPGPILVIHLIPFQRSIELDLEMVGQYQGLLPPIERVDNYSGRINFDGYQTTKQFPEEEKLAGAVQVFRTGQIESIREVPFDENRCIFADDFDNDIIRAVWSYSCALQGLGIKTPVALFVGFKHFEGFSLKSRRISRSVAQVQLDELRVPGISISDWNDVVKIENAAQTVKRVLDRFANAVGLPRSVSYAANGDWLGPPGKADGRASGVRKIEARSNVLELVGGKRTPNRVSVVLYDRNSDFLLGKVNPPCLEPTEGTYFKFLVNQDEMGLGAKEQLEASYKAKKRIVLGIGTFRFAGRITRLREAYGGGAYDGINIPQELTLMFEVEPVG